MGGINRSDAKLMVGRGWGSLIDKVYDRLPPSAYVLDCKEKFGGLRVYVDNVDQEIYDFLSEVENESYTICEECGKPGKPRKGGWIKTLCDECAVKRIIVKVFV